MADDNNPLGDMISGDGEPWALETTQRNIEDHLESLVKSQDAKVTKDLDKIQKNIKKATGYQQSLKDMAADSKKRSEKTTKKSEASGGFLQAIRELGLDNQKKDSLTDKKATSILGGGSMFGSMLRNVPIVGGVLGAMGDSVTRVVKNLGNLTTGFQTILLGIPVFGAALGFMAGWIGNTIDSFREMQMNGLTFSGSMFDLSIMAGQAGLDLGTFSKIILANSKLMKGIGGPKILADTVDAIRETGSRLGYSMESITEFSADYLEQQKISGMFDVMTDRQRRIGAARYIKELNNMAELTGISAKELSSEQRKLARNTKVLAAGAGLTGKELAEYNNRIQKIGLHAQRFGGDFATSIVEMAAHAKAFGGNFAASGPLGKFITSMPTLNDAMSNVVTTLNEGGDMDAAMINLGNSFERMSDSELARLKIQASRGNAEAGQILQMKAQAKLYNKQRQEEITALRRKNGWTYSQAVDELSERKKATAAFLGVQEKLQSAFGTIKSSIIRSLLDSGVFEKLGEVTTFLVEAFTDSTGGMASMIDMIAPFLDRFKLAFAGLKGNKDFNIFGRIIEAINEALFTDIRKEKGKEYGMGDWIGEKITELLEAIPWGTIISGIFKALLLGLATIFGVKAIIAGLGTLVSIGSWVMTAFVMPMLSAVGSAMMTGLSAIGSLVLDALIIAGSAILTAIGSIPVAILAGIVIIGASIISLFYFWDDIKAAWNKYVPSWEDIKALLPDWLSIDYWSEKFGGWTFELPTWEQVESLMPNWMSLNYWSEKFGGWTFELPTWDDIKALFPSWLLIDYWSEKFGGWTFELPSWVQVESLLPDWLSINYWSEKFGEWTFELPSWDDIKSLLPEWLLDPIGFFAGFFKNISLDSIVGGVGNIASSIGDTASAAYSSVTSYLSSDNDTIANVRTPTSNRLDRGIITATSVSTVESAAREQMTIAFDSSIIAKNSTLTELLEAIQLQNEMLASIAITNKETAMLNKELVGKMRRGWRLN